MDINTKRLLIELKESPIYSMSLGSKELFHTNVWEWMINTDSTIAGAFFDELKNSTSKLDVKREYLNLDLVIRNIETDEFYVIENKTKSLPDREQLKRYDDKIASKYKWFHLKGKLLTSIIEPDFKLIDWNYLSYNEIYLKLSEAINQSKIFNDYANKENLIIAKKYCGDLKKINDVISSYFNKNDKMINYEYDDEMFCNSRLQDIYLKLKANDLKNYILDNIKIDLEVNDFYLQISTGYSHGEPLLDVRYKKEGLEIGLQIQKYKYSRCVHRNGSPGFEEMFFEFSSKMKWLKSDYLSKSKRPFLVYDGHGAWQFIYQPRVLTEQEKNYSVFLSMIENDMLIAKKIIINNKL